MAGGASSVQIQDWGTSQRKASVVVSSDVTKNALVVSNPDWSNIATSTSLKTTLEKIQTASDYEQTYTFLDSWLTDERISTIVHSSASLDLSLTETFVWAGTSPNFYLATRTYS